MVSYWRIRLLGKITTYSNIVVTGTGRETALPVRLEVGRIDRVRVVLVVPVYDKWCGLHFDLSAVAGWLSSKSVGRLVRNCWRFVLHVVEVEFPSVG